MAKPQSSSSGHLSSSLGLLDLPLEGRLIIYAHIRIKQTTMCTTISQHTAQNTKAPLSILTMAALAQTCKVLWFELRNMLYLNISMRIWLSKTRLRTNGKPISTLGLLRCLTNCRTVELALCGPRLTRISKRTPLRNMVAIILDTLTKSSSLETFYFDTSCSSHLFNTNKALHHLLRMDNIREIARQAYSKQPVIFANERR